jgi:hypothetical protein
MQLTAVGCNRNSSFKHKSWLLMAVQGGVMRNMHCFCRSLLCGGTDPVQPAPCSYNLSCVCVCTSLYHDSASARLKLPALIHTCHLRRKQAPLWQRSIQLWLSDQKLNTHPLDKGQLFCVLRTVTRLVCLGFCPVIGCNCLHGYCLRLLGLAGHAE